MQNDGAAGQARRGQSRFVSALAWLSILLAGIATTVALLLNLKVWVPYPSELIHRIVAAFQSSARFFFSLLVVCSTALAAAIGLLLRRNWARILFMGLMGIAAVWALGGGLLLQLILVMSDPAEQPISTPSRVLLAALSVALAALFGWVVKKLGTETVRAEFRDR